MDTHAGKLASKHIQRRHESVCFASAALSSLFSDWQMCIWKAGVQEWGWLFLFPQYIKLLSTSLVNEALIADFHPCAGSKRAIQPFCKSPEEQSSVSPAAIIFVQSLAKSMSDM